MVSCATRVDLNSSKEENGLEPAKRSEARDRAAVSRVAEVGDAWKLSAVSLISDRKA